MKELRIEAGLTTFELAAKSGVSLSSINRIETGKKPVKRLIANKLLRTLNQELGMKIKLDDLSVLLAD
jgi:transcriptional regulator with XRE-family HTH domain